MVELSLVRASSRDGRRSSSTKWTSALRAISEAARTREEVFLFLQRLE